MTCSCLCLLLSLTNIVRHSINILKLLQLMELWVFKMITFISLLPLPPSLPLSLSLYVSLLSQLRLISPVRVLIFLQRSFLYRSHPGLPFILVASQSYWLCHYGCVCSTLVRGERERESMYLLVCVTRWVCSGWYCQLLQRIGMLIFNILYILCIFFYIP